MAHYIQISTPSELLRFSEEELVYVSSSGNYCNVVVSGLDERLVTLQLGQIERLIRDQLVDEHVYFVRLGKCLIVNTQFVHLINITKQQIILVDTSRKQHTLSASREALKALKEFMENK